MTDLSGVENTLKAIIVAGVYPSGTGQPSAMLMGATPLPCAVMRGWPNKEQLKIDLEAGLVVVSIWPRPGERNTSRYPREWEDLTPATHTIIATVNAPAGTITLSGTVSTPQNVAAFVNGAPYVYAVQSGDTLAMIAAGLAALIDDDTPASSLGAAITVPGGFDLDARVGGVGTLIRELKRQERQWMISLWCSTPERRDAAAPFIDGVMAGKGLANGRDRIMLTDGVAAQIRYAGTMPDDDAQAQGAFCRHLIFTIDYATTETTSATEVIVAATSLTNEAEDP